jgi:copper(I)-binding protein
MFVRILSLIAATLLASPAWPQDYKVGPLEISQPWTTPDRLIAARSTVSDKVEIHEMKMDGNVMRMRELDKGLEIPPGATVTLKPGGLHIMFMELKAPFANDTKVPVTLVFEKAGSVNVELLVQAMGAQPPVQHKQ